MLSFARNLLLLSTLLGISNSVLITDPSQVAGTTYDFVIVGGGNAGNVVASRLTENANFRVLVIEAGVTDSGVTDLIVPFLCIEASPNTPWTWNYTTAPQVALNNRVINYPRGKVLGGSSSVNFMFYTRGSSDDFNRIASITGDFGWSWSNIQQYIKKIEDFVHPQDNHNTAGQFNPAVHQTSGPLQITLPNVPTDLDNRVIQTTQQLPSEFPFNLDMNSGSPIGIGWAQSTTGGGLRSSSSSAYLDGPLSSRPNLDVLLQTQVTRLIQNGTSKGVPLFNAVEYAVSSGSTRYVVHAKREIIVSAGTTNTPQVLMLSGIGNTKTLRSLGIKTVVNLPGVGENLSDHPLLPNQFLINDTNSFEDIEQNATFATEVTEQWLTNQTGFLSNTLANHLGWLRLNKTDPIFKSFPDPASGPNTPHYEMIIGDGFASWTEPTPSTGHYLTILTTVASPAARGSVTLQSSNPFDFPIIDPGLVNNPFDLHVLVESVKTVRNFLSASPWKGYIISPFGGGASVDVTSESSIETFVKGFTSTEWHPVGTASMSPNGAFTGVVNPDLTVKGVAGVRVVDASVLPFVPAAHIQAAVYIVAERASDLIKAACA